MADTGGSDLDDLGKASWLTVPRRTGVARLRLAGRLLDCSVFGFAVESAERILLPHRYTVEFLDRDLRSQATATWCHLTSTAGRYRAGFELSRPTTPTGRRLLRYMQALVEPKGRRNQRFSSDPDPELHLETTAPCHTLAIADDPPRLRIESGLLPSLGSSIWLEIHAGSRVIDLRGRVARVNALRREVTVRQSQLEVDVTPQKYEVLAQQLGI